MRAGSKSRNKEGNSLLFITGYHSVKSTSLAKFWNFQFNTHQCLREKKFVLGLEKQHYFWWIWKSLQFYYVRGHEIAWHFTRVSCHLISIPIINKNVKFWYSLKVKPGFLILIWLKSRGSENMLRETGDSTPLPPPPSPKENVNILEQIMSAVKYPCIFPHQIENFFHLATSSVVNS